MRRDISETRWQREYHVGQLAVPAFSSGSWQDIQPRVSKCRWAENPKRHDGPTEMGVADRWQRPLLTEMQLGLAAASSQPHAGVLDCVKASVRGIVRRF